MSQPELAELVILQWPAAAPAAPAHVLVFAPNAPSGAVRLMLCGALLKPIHSSSAVEPAVVAGEVRHKCLQICLAAAVALALAVALAQHPCPFPFDVPPPAAAALSPVAFGQHTLRTVAAPAVVREVACGRAQPTAQSKDAATQAPYQM